MSTHRKAGHVTLVGEIYYATGRVSGKRICQSTGLRNKAAAVAKAKQILAAAYRGEWDKVFAVKQKNTTATFQDVFDRFKAAKDIQLSERSRTGYIQMMQRFVYIVTASNPVEALAVRLHQQEWEKVGAMRLSVLDGAAVRKFQAAWLESAGTDELKKGAAAVSCNCYVRNARSLFGRKAMQRNIYKGLVMPPTLNDFMKAVPLTEPDHDVYIPPEQEIVDKLWTESLKLRTEDPLVWVAFWCAAMVGFRRKETCFARYRWIRGDVVKLQTETDFIPKGKRARDIPTVPVFRQELLKVAAAQGWDTSPGAYVLAINPKPGVKRPYHWTYRRLGLWMRKHGWTRRETSHEFRKLFATQLCEKHGEYAAQMALGHQELETTTRYAARPKLRAIDPSNNVYNVVEVDFNRPSDCGDAANMI
jgi:integrase